MTKKENNKKLKRSDLDPTPPAQQSWRNLPPVLGDTKERKKASKRETLPPDGGRSNQRARAYAHAGRKQNTRRFFVS